MKNHDIDELLQRALRGNLAPDEQALWDKLLAADPPLRSRFEEESLLNRMLRLPDAPLSTNFTALTVQAARRATPEPPARTPWLFGLPGFRTAFARVATSLALLAILGATAALQYRQSARADVARSAGAFAEIANALSTGPVPPVELFRDFEAIQSLTLPDPGEVDMELLVALQK